MLGLSEEEEAAALKKREVWGLDRWAMAIIGQYLTTEHIIGQGQRDGDTSKEERGEGHNNNTEDQLEKIMNFVSYLEN